MTNGYLEPLVHDLWRDARALCVATATELAAHEHDIIEARECLNDALAKVERQKGLAA